MNSLWLHRGCPPPRLRPDRHFCQSLADGALLPPQRALGGPHPLVRKEKTPPFPGAGQRGKQPPSRRAGNTLQHLVPARHEGGPGWPWGPPRPRGAGGPAAGGSAPSWRGRRGRPAGGLRHGGGELPAPSTAAPPSAPPARHVHPPAPPRPVPSPPGGGARGTHRVRIGAEVLEGEGAEDEAREQGRRALALHAPDNGGPRRGGGSPQRPPAAGQGRARWGTSPPVRERRRREEAACGARAAACPGPLRRRGVGSPQPPALPALRQASPPPSLSRPLPASWPARLAAKPALNGVILVIC